MSEECCGVDAPLKSRGTESVTLLGTATAGTTPDAAPASRRVDAAVAPWWKDRALALPAASGALLAASVIVGWSGVTDGVTFTLQFLSLLAGATTFVPGAVRRLLRGSLGVGLLMTIAGIGAVLLGHVGEATALAFLFSIAEALEDRAMDRARQGLRALLALIPDAVVVEREGAQLSVPTRDIVIGDVLVVRAGERVASDGIVVSGRGSIDTSAVTGESLPAAVDTGDAVLAGSINGEGSLRIRTTAAGTDNSLTTIVRLVEEANGRKGARARLADRIARPLVPIVLGVAAAIVGFGFLVGDPELWTERALVVLVAASPCALAIAVPVTVISAIGSASKLGIIVKSGAAFERMGSIRTVAFDKTGTLTRNQPTVIAVETVDGVTRDEVLSIAAALETHSTHPLAHAVLVACPDHPEALEVREDAGRGISGTVNGVSVRAGSTRWMDAGELSPAALRLADDGMTVMAIERSGIVIGLLGIRDELRPDAAEAVSQLASAGIRTLMLTGDNSRTATTIAAEAGISDVRAELLPADKADAIAALSQESPTAMIGDGINDAPALATADVGIAMGATGSAAAVESADVAFTGSDLRLIPVALLHARRGRRIMTGNIVLSLAIIVGLFPLALTGVLGLAGVVLVHELAELVVILNGLRAARLSHSLDSRSAMGAGRQSQPVRSLV
ncbi:cation-translocating P-type ATPase [Salinibacterium sp. SWN167]|uniref:heavy metal translocating P-type ATPase n=1 Tax=Salinibacterium sp. SWN167 TaxID=2792054 RepID=UPI0018CC90B2|nr:cation-translocating P-type ATPase [Salinibacterium sp. SWN167]MBH0082953.1 cadmium-translocating P-type ATPase [Salinibacterium sp. SWN167]